MKYTSVRHFPAGVLHQNWGDVISPFLFKKLAKFEPKRFPMGGPPSPTSDPILLMAGSVLPVVDSNTGVWGTGFITSGGNCKKPLQIYAVRGPLTREWLLKRGMECPEVYGDPALVLPEIYKSSVKKQYELGIVPHYIDQKHPWVQKAIKDSRVLFIDILTGEGGILKFIDQICSCKCIISSSLHGLICADAYKVPSLWIEFSDKVIGHGFKFRDYFLSVGRKEIKAIDFNENMSVDDILSMFYNYTLNFDVSKLLSVCPLLEQV